MNPPDSSVESIEAGCWGRERLDRGRSLVKPFEVWLKTHAGTFAITFDRFCADADRTLTIAAAT
jgi:hypothetical protein